jgi:thiol-disulfide isomerase/thioredoxin
MLLKLYIALLLILALTIKAIGQRIEINLKASDTSVVQTPTRPFSNTSFLATNPLVKYPNWSLRRIAYYNVQAMYENLPDNPVRKKLFKEFLERYEVDSSYLTKQKIPENYIYLTTALDKDGNKHIIIDANNNHDFNDDHEYVFNTQNKMMPVFNALVKYYDGYSIREADVPLQIDNYNLLFDADHYKSDIERKLDLSINVLLINKTGNIVLNNQTFKVNILKYDKLHPKSIFEINIQKFPFDKKNNNGYKYKSSDTLEIADRLYKVTSLEDNKLFIKLLGKSKIKNAETGTFAPEIISTDIKTNTPFSLAAQKGKYVLIDFWGSWCVPCIRLIPEMKRLNEKYKSRIQFVSVAYDRSNDLKKVQKLIEEKKMTWVQLLDDRNSKNGIIDQFKVNEFPTCLLIDPAGKVIYRGLSDDGLKELISFFDERPR